jgi:hypothetical protein
VWSVSRLCNKDQLSLGESPELTEEYLVDMRWLPACKDMNPEAEKCTLLEDFIKQSGEDCERALGVITVYNVYSHELCV